MNGSDWVLETDHFAIFVTVLEMLLLLLLLVPTTTTTVTTMYC